MNLLNKLTEKTKKRIAAAALAGGMALTSAFGLVGCTNTNSDPGSNPGPGIQTSGGDNSGGSNNQTPDYSGFSQILQNVLTDQYYRNLISNANSYNETYSCNNQSYLPIPYGFLEDQGFNTSKYKNGQSLCYAYLFSIDNHLYIQLYSEIQSITNYNVNFILKYSLTDQEIKELYNLFSPLFSNNKETTYFQAPFFIQELSYLKTPEILSISYSTNDSTLSANEYFNKKQFLSNNHISSYIKSEPVENSQTIFHYYLIRPSISTSRGNSRAGVIKIHTIGHSSFYEGNKFVFSSTQLNISGKITSENRTKFEENIQSIVSYNCANHYFKDLTNWEFWEDWQSSFNN